MPRHLSNRSAYLSAFTTRRCRDFIGRLRVPSETVRLRIQHPGIECGKASFRVASPFSLLESKKCKLKSKVSLRTVRPQPCTV